MLLYGVLESAGNATKEGTDFGHQLKVKRFGAVKLINIERLDTKGIVVHK